LRIDFSEDDAAKESAAWQDIPSPLTPLPKERGTDVGSVLRDMTSTFFNLTF